MDFHADGLQQASARMARRAQSIRDLTPAFRVFGAWLDKQTDDCFEYSRDFNGTPFVPLAQSTIEARIRHLKAATKTTRVLTSSGKRMVKFHKEKSKELRTLSELHARLGHSALAASAGSRADEHDLIIRHLKHASGASRGILTAKAAEFQQKLRAPGGIKPLIDTGRARNSARSAPSKSKLRWSAVGYLGPHLDGHGHPPKRDASAFDKVSGTWRLNPRAWNQLRAVVTRFVQTGAVG